MNFEKSNDIKKIAEAYALDAVDFAKNAFKIDLDQSEQSIQKVEEILDFLHRSSKTEKPSDDKILQFAKIFGCYIGEVYHRNYDAEWGISNINGEVFQVIHFKDNTIIFPIGKVYHRIVNGAEDNVWDYHQIIIQNFK